MSVFFQSLFFLFQEKLQLFKTKKIKGKNVVYRTNPARK
jgi:hypothetical protein